MKYRAEIDGLRALAVVAVIQFHAGVELFSGGFVGVDIFFVISGYLITSIIIEDIENQRFSILNFYERRARRILPALFFIMLICMPFAWLWMLPSQIQDFTQSLIAVSLFASNVLFWHEGGYFDDAAANKPLLHTWSLAVEEQYYVLFPVFLILVWRFGKNRVFWATVGLAVISLILSEWAWRNSPTAGFFLTPMRAWELLCGSIAAFIVQRNGVMKSDKLAWLGLTAIVLSIFTYDQSTPMPSFYALVPVLGVVLILLYAGKETRVASFLSTKIFVGIGLMSYSAYLWHQPLFAFARIRALNDPSDFFMYGLGFVSFFLAYFSWKHIEMPARNNYSRAKVWILSLGGISFFFMVALAVHLKPEKYIPNYEWVAMLSANTGLGAHCDALNIRNINQCSTRPRPAVAIYGDSHAMHLVDGFGKEFRENVGVVQLTKSGCSPLINIAEEDHRAQECIAFNRAAREFLRTNDDIKVVVISSRFGLLDENALIRSENTVIADESHKKSAVLSEFNKVVDELVSVDKRVLLFSSTPQTNSHFRPGECVFNALNLKLNLDNCSFIAPSRNKNGGLYIFDTIERADMQKIDLTKQLCPDNFCLASVEGLPVFGKGSHLSKFGAEYLGRKFKWGESVTEQCAVKNCVGD